MNDLWQPDQYIHKTFSNAYKCGNKQGMHQQ